MVHLKRKLLAFPIILSQKQRIVPMPIPGGEGMGGVCAGTVAGKPAEPAVAKAGTGAD